MEISIKNPTEAISVINLSGKFTIEDVNIFKEKTVPVVSKPIKTILISFEGLEYIDSSGIGSLILLMNTAKNLNINLIIYNLQSEIMNVFKIAYLDKFFSISTTQELKSAFPGITL